VVKHPGVRRGVELEKIDAQNLQVRGRGFDLVVEELEILVHGRHQVTNLVIAQEPRDDIAGDVLRRLNLMEIIAELDEGIADDVEDLVELEVVLDLQEVEAVAVDIRQFLKRLVDFTKALSSFSCSRAASKFRNESSSRSTAVGITDLPYSLRKSADTKHRSVAQAVTKRCEL